MSEILTGPFNSTPAAIPGVTNLQVFIGYAAWLATAACIIGLVLTGAMMAISYQHGNNEHMGRLGSVIAGCITVGAASPIVGSVLGFNLFTSNPQAIPGLGTVQTIISYTAWVAAALCLLGLIVAGVRMAISYQRGNTEATGRLGAVIAGCVIVGSASTLVGAFI
jgi:cytochrome b561